MGTKLAKKSGAQTKCMVCKKRPVKQRKVCSVCLAAAHRAMAKPDELDDKGNPPAGKITEQQAIDAGLIGRKARHESDWHKVAREKFPNL